MGNTCCGSKDPRLEVGPPGTQNPQQRKQIIKDIKAKKKRQKKGEGPSADSMLKNFKERDDEVEKQSE